MLILCFGSIVPWSLRVLLSSIYSLGDSFTSVCNTLPMEYIVAFAGDAESEACVVTRFLLNGEHGVQVLFYGSRSSCTNVSKSWDVFLGSRFMRCRESMDDSYWAAFDQPRQLIGFKTFEVRWASSVILLLTSHLLSYISTLRLHFVWFLEI